MKKTKWMFILSVIGLIISSPCYAQEWAKTYGGSGWEYPGSIQQTIDGGYVVGGQTASFGEGEYDICVSKLDSMGNVLWENTYGGLYGDSFYSLEQASDGGYIVAGSTLYSNDFDAISDFWIIKLDSAGNVAWDKTYGRRDGDYWVSVQEVFAQEGSTDGWIVVGKSAGDMWVLRLDPDGDVVWQKVYSGQNGSEQPYEIHQTYNLEGNPDGFIVAGSTSSFGEGNYDMWVVKLDNDGEIVWEKTYGGDGGDYIHSMQKTFDELGNPDGYIAAGASWSFGGNDMWVVRLDTDGDILWQKKYGRSQVSEANSVQQTFDGLGNPDGYVVAGGTRSFSVPGSLFAWVLKVDLNGTVIWEKTYGGSDDDAFESIKQTTDGGYVVTGSTESFGAESGNIWVLKLDANGEIPYCSAMIDGAFANVSLTSAVVGLSYMDVQTSTAAIGSLGVTAQASEAQTSVVCSASTGPPVIDKLKRRRREPGQRFNIVGSNFGSGNPGDYVRIGPKQLLYDHQTIIEWTPTNIKVKIKKKKYVKNGCAWFKGLDEKKVKVWVNVGGVDSNKKRLTLIKNPADCQ